MSTHNWNLSARYPLCPAADSLYRTGEVIFRTLTCTPTPEMVAAAKAVLARYHADLLAQLYPMHYGVSVGRHICVQFVYQEATARLCALAATMQPAPESAPAPPEPLRTLTDVVRNLKDTLQPAPDDFPIGIDDEIPDLESNQ
jgi:hypothetical protein